MAARTPKNKLRGPVSRHSAYVLVLLAIYALVLLLSGCEINKPEVPIFTTTLAVPIGEKRIDVQDLVEDEDFLVVDGEAGLSFTITGDPDSLAIESDLSVDLEAQTVAMELGNIELHFDPSNFEFALGDIYPPAAGVHGASMILPPFPIDNTSPPNHLSGFSVATMASGDLSVTVSNGWPVPISADAGPAQIALILVDEVSGADLATVLLPELAPGASTTQTADLSGKTVHNIVSVRIVGAAAGSGGLPVLVDGDDLLTIETAFENLQASSAQAAVAAQSQQTDMHIDLPADYEIASAVIESGSIAVTIVNELAIPCTASLLWPEITNLAGDMVSVSVAVDAGASAQCTIDLADGIITAPAGQLLTQLTGLVHILSPGSGGQEVDLNATDNLRAEIAPDTIEFRQVTGMIPPVRIALDPVIEEIELPEGIDGLEVTVACLVIELTTTAGLPMELDMDLTGTSDSGTERTLVVHREVQPNLNRAARVTRIMLDQNNSDILAFVNNMPVNVSLSGSVTAGGDGGIGTVHANDYTVIDWEILAPAEVIITGSVITADPTGLDLDQDTRDLIRDHAGAASVSTALVNHLPVAVEVTILAGTDLATIGTDPLLTIGPISVPAGQIDPVTHTVIAAAECQPLITLTAEEAKTFAQLGLHTILSVTLPSTEGEAVRLMASDYLSATGVVSLDVEVNDQW